jgi:superfamily I DNA/RNA helicase
MRILPPVTPTAEQLTILTEDRPGFLLVRGAAGSGKTTTALLRLRHLCATRLRRRARLGHSDPVRVLVLTYNRTLEGYIRELAYETVKPQDGLELQVSTFDKWAVSLLGRPQILSQREYNSLLHPLVSRLPPEDQFLREEVGYILGRFTPDNLPAYVTAKREGRGLSPRIEAPMRQRLLDEVVYPYQEEKFSNGYADWNDVAVQARSAIGIPWDVVIVDEAQDFSANQVRAALNHLANDFTVTFVIDATQRIYPRYFSWREVGIESYRNKRLARNYRNTRQIAAFARPLVEGLPVDVDGSLPDFTACTEDGPLPVVLRGKYGDQIRYALEFIRRNVDTTRESVAFLQPKGGHWFDELHRQLGQARLPFCELTGLSQWPTGPEAIALCTLYSAKGLEFDHVVIPGLNQQVTPHGIETGDSRQEVLRRLVAMGIGRARRTLHIGYKEDERSALLDLLEPGTFQEMNV